LKQVLDMPPMRGKACAILSSSLAPLRQGAIALRENLLTPSLWGATNYEYCILYSDFEVNRNRDFEKGETA
jgi:hypothetical protein